jgi:hypothetical protein
MPVPFQIPLITHIGNGVTTVFAFPFTVLLSSQLRVQLDGVTTSVGFTVTGVGSSSGTVTFAAAPAAGVLVRLSRVTRLERTRDYQQNGDLLADTVDLDFDQIWLAMQELFLYGAGGDNYLRVPLNEALTALPAASLRLGRVVGFDATTGDAIVSPWTMAQVSSLLAGGGGGGGGGGAGGGEIVGTPENFPGLDPTGATDSTAGLQAFFDACQGRRGYLPAGWYKKSAQIVLDPRYSYHVEGAGWTSENTLAPPWGTVIEDTNDSNGLFIYYTFANFPGGPAGATPTPLPNSDNKVYLAHFRLRGPRVFTPAGTQTIGIEGTPTVTPKGNGIFAYWVQGLHLHDMWIDGYQSDGLYGYRCFSIVLDHFWTIKNNRVGIHLFKTANAVRMSGIKSLANGLVRSSVPHYNILIDSDSQNFACLGFTIDGPSDVSYCGMDNGGPSYFSRANAKLTNIVVSGGTATATGVGFNFLAGDKVGVSGCTTQRALNTLYPANLISATSTTLTWSTGAPNGTYTDVNLAISPYGTGIGLDFCFGAQIQAYCEDPSGVGLYIGANCKGITVQGGYWQDARILVDTGARGVAIREPHYAGIRAGDHWAETISMAERTGQQFFNLAGRGLAASSSGDGFMIDDAALNSQGVYLGRGFGGQITNVAAGPGALRVADSTNLGLGRKLTALGFRAGGAATTAYDSVYIGHLAAFGVTVGFENTVVGSSSLNAWPNAQRVTGIGFRVGENTTAGGSDTLAGYLAGSHGSNAQSNGSNAFFGSLAGAMNGAQEIGTSTIIGAQTAAFSGGTGISNYTGVGFDTMQFAAVNRFQAGNGSVSSARVQVAWTIVSDRNAKAEIQTLEGSMGLEFINALRPVSYRRKDINGNPAGLREIGLIAQEVEDVLPNVYGMVPVEPDGTYGLRKDDLIGSLVLAVQQLRASNVALAARVATLEA